MEHDQESEVKYEFGSWKFVVRIPEHYGWPIGMCRYRDKLLMTTDRGYVLSWDEDAQVMEEIAAFPWL